MYGITGGARGIGLAIAMKYIEEGAKVIRTNVPTRLQKCGRRDYYLSFDRICLPTFPHLALDEPYTPVKGDKDGRNTESDCKFGFSHSPEHLPLGQARRQDGKPLRIDHKAQCLCGRHRKEG